MSSSLGAASSRNLIMGTTNVNFAVIVPEKKKPDLARKLLRCWPNCIKPTEPITCGRFVTDG